MNKPSSNKKAEKKRCKWAQGKPGYYTAYHDKEWGKPIKRDQTHFELICLEGAQAGLSWDTVLQKRDHYRKLFYNFNIQRCANLKDSYLEKCLKDPGIIRNRLKVFSLRTNAKAFMAVQKEFGTFNAYIGPYVDKTPIVNNWKTMSDVPANTEISDVLSKDLKKRGFKFVGSTIVYAYMQSAGLVNDHTLDCAWHPNNQI